MLYWLFLSVLFILILSIFISEYNYGDTISMTKFIFGVISATIYGIFMYFGDVNK